ncbi:type II toxin-antitoxin system death-on-curing family toxin [Weissella paramesenteroides]|uniref:type II toxin-antitoxin system death-on-curing family toxin n=1 Tax=Weissella paramesenteroides TaxID=1249 RepID=UPI00123AFBC8|nr:type II toxin-antitoxin system death-on-curing family toxin [Weissella paramesenteroides]KAA8453977.1 type II toxin-antitoxin system death-on-curing family toxin [Weissella paramesenteroides]KAA8455857.1 type II toxin-antitoxin system death-on-curing family toxin [Weissella paramesenteroides]KAA8457403.1 type II toxin-antitoxin system death-on-curing family toxin [Weissella paramesenteroides]KAA8461292.1 type II toxin-antitoxin system death-on-curing family toxin [Weissella paramesenteroides
MNDSDKVKTIIYPVLGEKQDKEFNKLLQRQISEQFGDNKLSKMEDDDGNVVAYVTMEITTRATRATINIKENFIQVRAKVIDFDYDTLLKLNDTARNIFEEEGVYGVKFGGQLKSILMRSLYPPFDYDYPTTIIERAAFYWVEIATKQAFNNGNKRTAFLAALTYLELNGYELDTSELTSKKLYNTSLRIANHELDKDDVYNLIFDSVSIKMFGD